MSNTARKARKKAGIPFSKPAKVGTPPHERAIPEVFKRDALFGGMGFFPSSRAKARIDRRYGPWKPLGGGLYVAPANTPAPTSPLG